MNPAALRPPPVRIKFCGITRLPDAQAALALGVDYLGLVFVPASPRYLPPAQAAALVADASVAGGCFVGLFQNASADAVRQAIAHSGVQMLQFHGAEDAAFCGQFGLPYLKAVPMADQPDWAYYQQAFASSHALLADSHSLGGSRVGGSGHAFNWQQLPPLAARRQPLMLAGGLTAHSVAGAIASVHPWAVDVSSGIEAAKGIKDPAKMRAFVEAVRSAPSAP